MSLSENDVSLNTNDLLLSVNDISQYLTEKTIAVTIYRYIYRLKLISVKYHPYIAIFAIFNDYRLEYFCTIL